MVTGWKWYIFLIYLLFKQSVLTNTKVCASISLKPLAGQICECTELQHIIYIPKDYLNEISLTQIKIEFFSSNSGLVDD